MMNTRIFKRLAGLVIVMVTILPVPLSAQRKKASPTPVKAETQTEFIVNGYSKDVHGEKISYHSCHPEANSALLVRCENETQYIEWETEAAPAGTGDVTFAWIAGYSSGTSSNDHTYQLSVNGSELVSFITPKGGKSGDWSVKGGENSSLRFQFQKADGVKDQSGYMFLTLPRRLLDANGRARIRIAGDHTGSRDWLMTFRYGYSEKITLLSEARIAKADNGQQQQFVKVAIDHFASPADYTIASDGATVASGKLGFGINYAHIAFPVVTTAQTKELSITIGGKTQQRSITLNPVRKMTIYVLPHSHTDIGYTEIQTKIEKKQVNNLLEGIRYARQTKDYPIGSRFIWNVEVAWAADLYLHRLNDQQKMEFMDAVRDGSVSLNGMYLNELTGLCRPEELLRLFKFSTELAKQCNVKIDAAMMSDVPGNTWGTVTAMAKAGIKYFSTAPNYFDRIGDILVKWENKPFYWVSPSGKEKVLVWIPYKGYALSHGIGYLTADFVASYSQELEKEHYPYDIAYIRWSGHGDNAVPDPEICEFVKTWNAQNEWPRFIIASTGTAFSAFEEKYSAQLPEQKGDWTGYWEDGAGSSALETGMNRNTADRLTQAETLWTMLNPKNYPVQRFEDAWKKVLLYSEHTWGADCSVTDPESQKTKEQWAIKKSYADSAATFSYQLLDQAASSQGTPLKPNTIDVVNTTSWPRTDLVVVPEKLSLAGDVVKDEQGRQLPSQRLSSRELAFVVSGVPAFSSRRYTITKGKPLIKEAVKATSASLENSLLKVQIDPVSGAISSLRRTGIANNFADSTSGNYLNDYLFLNGNKLTNVKRNGPVKVTVKEKGPLVAILTIESGAPGCNKLTRELRLVAGFDYLEMNNTVDKTRAEIVHTPGDYSFANTGGKESLNFGFPFNVTGGEVKLDIPLGIMSPEKDQIPSACKNWLEVGRWADVSNSTYGITWATLDAPLVQVGGLTATMLGGQTNPDVWRKKIEPTQKLYSWALNNHWETNYRAYQEGLISFRYALRPHLELSTAEATRFATGLTQPLLVLPATTRSLPSSGMALNGKNSVILSLKPSDDGKATMVTLYNPSSTTEAAELKWSSPVKVAYLSNTGEDALTQVKGAVEVPALGVVILRVEH